MREANEGWARYIQRVVDVEYEGNQSALAQAIGVSPSTVTRWIDGATPTIGALHEIRQALGTPMAELLVAAGALDGAAEQAGHKVKARPVSVVEAIENDPELLDEARAHLLNQYQLLLRIASPVPATDPRKKSQARMSRLRADVRGQQRPEKERERGTGTQGDG